MDHHCICKLRKIYKALSVLEDQMMQTFGLNLNETMLLCLLSKYENPTANEISEQMSLSHSNASKVIASLEKKGLISRKICKEDKRSMRFNLTREGREQLEKVNCENIVLPDCLQSLM
ncbi:MAG: MarR family transcriptional regulator [Prevotella sp.]|jgi:DNA-binding MarR family transcriptional regulator|nr:MULTISPECIES: MarR family transcriptional regulator [unclassified Prevotella]MCH3969875.1 MarR family transcriptional regulator [Prevotella sp.]MCH3991182.1 MarR family transcriptional regulator [Prevotella sp.]MCH4018346.1 MarR family transcriptional regulator [Prevotella sp.]MCH4100667.1 MarR family transcriptional regulator [Prevotella sp.]MCH4216909.1 MarR family transcriptional regulator [Prevotella sp.]